LRYFISALPADFHRKLQVADALPLRHFLHHLLIDGWQSWLNFAMTLLMLF
jgi:hypothetical protein